MMHDDDRLLPGFLGRLYDFLEGNEKVVAVGCNAFLIGADGNRLGQRLISKRKGEVSIYKDPIDMACLYSNGFIPFPSVVYRNGFAQKVPFREENGKVGDSYFLCELATYGSIAFLDEALFEYRIHSGQDSSVLPFDQLRRRDEYLLTISLPDPKRRSVVLRNVSRFETKQALLKIVLVARKTRSARRTMECLESVRTPHFNPIHLFGIILAEWRNINLMLNALRSK
jgi:hypothetical protein